MGQPGSKFFRSQEVLVSGIGGVEYVRPDSLLHHGQERRPADRI
jgi:hypothetical protein